MTSPAGRERAGGDWCDGHPLSDDLTVLTVGNVSGHATAASRTMEFMRGSIAKARSEHRIPTDILAHVDTLAYGMNSGTIVTAIVAILDHRLRTFTFANAGHPPPHTVGDLAKGNRSQAPRRAVRRRAPGRYSDYPVYRRTFRNGREADDAAVLAVRIGAHGRVNTLHQQQSRKDVIYASHSE